MVFRQTQRLQTAGSKVRSFGQWAAATCAVPPVSLLVIMPLRIVNRCWLGFPCMWRYINVATFNLLPLVIAHAASAWRLLLHLCIPAAQLQFCLQFLIHSTFELVYFIHCSIFCGMVIMLLAVRAWLSNWRQPVRHHRVQLTPPPYHPPISSQRQLASSHSLPISSQQRHSRCM